MMGDYAVMREQARVCARRGGADHLNAAHRRLVGGFKVGSDACFDVPDVLARNAGSIAHDVDGLPPVPHDARGVRAEQIVLQLRSVRPDHDQVCVQFVGCAQYLVID